MRRTWRFIVVVFAAGVLVYTFWVYWVKAWQETASSERDEGRHALLRQLYAALESYRATAGHWPESLDAVRSAVPSLGENDLWGPRRLEYRGGGAGKVLLVSFGHREPVRGWNLLRDEVVWVVYRNGDIKIVPLKRAEKSGPQ